MKLKTDTLYLALKIVADINQIIYDNSESGVYNYLILETDGNGFELKYLGQTVFDSYEDTRENDDPLLDFIWDKIFEIHDDISTEKKWIYQHTSECRKDSLIDE